LRIQESSNGDGNIDVGGLPSNNLYDSEHPT
jgi:hypothetical protein